MAKEIDPKSTTRAKAFEFWMQAPNPMVTFFKTLNVTRLVKVSKKHGLMFNMLMDHECNHCAIFARRNNGEMYAALKVENETDNPVMFFGQKDNNNFFKEWDDELDLHCYGLLVETKNGEWKIIED